MISAFRAVNVRSKAEDASVLRERSQPPARIRALLRRMFHLAQEWAESSVIAERQDASW